MMKNKMRFTGRLLAAFLLLNGGVTSASERKKAAVKVGGRVMKHGLTLGLGIIGGTFLKKALDGTRIPERDVLDMFADENDPIFDKHSREERNKELSKKYPAVWSKRKERLMQAKDLARREIKDVIKENYRSFGNVPDDWPKDFIETHQGVCAVIGKEEAYPQRGMVVSTIKKKLGMLMLKSAHQNAVKKLTVQHNQNINKLINELTKTHKKQGIKEGRELAQQEMLQEAMKIKEISGFFETIKPILERKPQTNDEYQNYTVNGADKLLAKWSGTLLTWINQNHVANVEYEKLQMQLQEAKKLNLEFLRALNVNLDTLPKDPKKVFIMEVTKLYNLVGETIQENKTLKRQLEESSETDPAGGGKK